MQIKLSDVDMFAGGKLLFRDISLSINRNDKIGIIGRNGSGKSHLLKVLGGVMNPDAGEREVKNNTKVLLINQELPEDDKTPIEYLREHDPDIVSLNEELDITDTQSDRFAQINDLLGDLEDERYEQKAPWILRGLGLKDVEINKPMRQLSGGLRMRVSIAAALIQMPDVLLLDEPTNHLDLESAQWLIEFLKNYPHTVVIVSHDIKLLNTFAKTTYHLKKNALTQYSCNYDQFLLETKRQEEKDVQKNKDLEKQAKQAETIYYKFRGIASRAAQATQRLKKSEDLREQVIEIIPEEPIIPLCFTETTELRSPVVTLENVCVGYQDKIVLKDLNLSMNYGAKVGLLGRNGEGKSTLIKLITESLLPIKGAFNTCPKLKIGYFSQDLADQFDKTLTVYAQFSKATEILNDEKLRNLLGSYGFSRDKVEVKVGNLSGGELARLALAIICTRSPNLIILDEPTNHLDVETRAVLVDAIKEFKGSVLLVSHDWDLHEKSMKDFWVAEAGTVKPYDKGLQNYRKSIEVVSTTNSRGFSTKPAAASDNANAFFKPEKQSEDKSDREQKNKKKGSTPQARGKR
jgi:ATP-binding cassette subfamily F protein 3